MVKSNLKDIIKNSNTKSTEIGKEKYSNTLAARIAKANQVLGLEQETVNNNNVEKVEKLLISLPKEEFNEVDLLIESFLKAGKHITKSELFRLGLILVKSSDMNSTIEKLNTLKKLKTGRKKLS